VFANLGEGTTRGIEMWGTWYSTPTWRISGGLVTQRIDTGLKPGSNDVSGSSGLATNDPSHYWMLRSSHDLSEKAQLDVTLRRMGSLPSPAVPAYYDMDMRLGWKVRPNVELAAIGQNLLHASHPEFGAAPARSVFERTLFLQMLLKF
jgi:iron complex outermembrane receptor protein